MINSKVQSVISWTRRYVSLPLVVAVVYAAFVLFFNENSYSHSAELQNQIDELRAQIKENNDTMQYYLRLNHNLDTDPATLERIVRERYHMQRPNEDVYLVDRLNAETAEDVALGRTGRASPPRFSGAATPLDITV